MSEKRSKYDTDPLDPDFVRRTEEMRGATGEAAGRPLNEQQARRDPALEEQTRRFDEQIQSSYPSVFVPPSYQPPQQGYNTFGAGTHQPPAAPVPPRGPSSPYDPYTGQAASSRPVAKLGLSEKVANVLPYAPFYIGVVAAIVELLLVPRQEVRTRFHAAQGLALQLAMIAGSFIFSIIGGITHSKAGGMFFGLACFIFLIVSMVRVSKGKSHHLAPLDEPARWLNQHIEPRK
ncbi:MAG TPA: hypothetical protein VM934_18075 [Pyrinomonadaceae bacterium]|jgi:uncharacterized membrane protein|nr:hypothetical protein [Pyrinomonadaceae bacterium]